MADVATFATGDVVTIGGGKVRWTVQSFGEWPPDGAGTEPVPYAVLQHEDGWNQTTSVLSRLHHAGRADG